MVIYGVVAHGGAGSPSLFSDGCKEACELVFRLLQKGKGSLEAAVEAARILEDDGRFNAGSGSSPRLDGKTVEMDAAVMDSKENIGIVISIRNVKNPILVARAVMETPHVALSGEGATAFARKRGFAPLHQISPYAQKRYKKVKKFIKEGKLGKEIPLWKDKDIESLWNFDDTSYSEIFGETIGVVTIDEKGTLAVATSTGGFSPMMQGRVGDSSMVGCGFYAGTTCALATTGMGEEIIKRMLAKTVYDMVSHGEDIKRASEKGIILFPPEIAVGIIAISREGYAVASNTEMAHYALIKEI